MNRSSIVSIAAIAAAAALAAQPAARTKAPRLWTQAALAGWALPVAGVKATPHFYTEAEYYAAPIDELRNVSRVQKGSRAQRVP